MRHPQYEVQAFLQTSSFDIFQTLIFRTFKSFSATNITTTPPDPIPKVNMASQNEQLLVAVFRQLAVTKLDYGMLGKDLGLSREAARNRWVRFHLFQVSICCISSRPGSILIVEVSRNTFTSGIRLETRLTSSNRQRSCNRPSPIIQP